MRHFFITSRPRSRTAWLANFLTWGETFCFHDSLKDRDPHKLHALFQSVPGKAVGHADPANLYFQDALREEFPGAVWVFIDRPAEQCAKSLQACIDQPVQAPALAIQERLVEKLLTRSDVLHIPFAELDSMALDIAAYARGEEVAMPPRRVEMLTRLQVQIHPEILRREVTAQLGLL